MSVGPAHTLSFDTYLEAFWSKVGVRLWCHPLSLKQKTKVLSREA